MTDEVIDGEMIVMPPITHFEVQAQAWEIREEESPLWYERFTYYLKQGHTRTIYGAYKSYCKAIGKLHKDYPPQAWYKKSGEKGWENRAKTYDQYLRALDAKDNAEARKAAKGMRMELLEVTQEKLLGVVKKWEPEIDDLDWKSIRDTLTVLLELSREEFGDTEPDKTLALNVHANGANAFEASVKQVYGE